MKPHDLLEVNELLGDKIDVTISELKANGKTGKLLQSMSIRVGCNMANDVTLNKSFGALTLVGFSDRRYGLQSMVATIRLEYMVMNEKNLPTDLTGAVTTSPFQDGGKELIKSPTTLRFGEQQVISSEEIRLNLLEIELNIQTITMGVDGVGTADDTECSAETVYEFIVA